jgi:hypothetical protein
MRGEEKGGEGGEREETYLLLDQISEGLLYLESVGLSLSRSRSKEQASPLRLELLFRFLLDRAPGDVSVPPASRFIAMPKEEEVLRCYQRRERE